MIRKITLLFFLGLLLQQFSHAQTVFNPFTQNVHFTPEPDSLGFPCGTTQHVEFTQGITTKDSALQYSSSPLQVKICLSGFTFSGSASANVSGSYASHFSWAYDANNASCIIGTQINTLPGTGNNPLNPDPNASGTIQLTLQVPSNLNTGTVLSVNVQLILNAYLSFGNSMADDIETTQTQTYCTNNTCIQKPQIIAYPTKHFCYGQNIVLHAVGVPGAQLSWIKPSNCQGNSTSNVAGQSDLTIKDFDQNCEGIFMVKQVVPGCSNILYDTIVVQGGNLPIINQITSSCNGNIASVQVQANSSAALEYSINGNAFQSSNVLPVTSGAAFHIVVREVGSSCLAIYDGACVHCNAGNNLCALQVQDSIDAPAMICGGSAIPLQGFFSQVNAAQWSAYGSGSFSLINALSSPSINYYQPSLNDIERGYVVIYLTTDDPDGVGPCLPKTCSKIIYIYNGLVPPTLTTNAPVCEYSQLQLFAHAFVGNILWQGPNGFTQQNKTITIDPVSILNQGKYYTSITGYGCQTVQDSIDIEIHALPSLQVNINAIPEFCAGTGNGSIQVQVNGGSGNYMICKDGGQANCLNGNAVNFNYVQAGSHVVYVTDQLCPDTSWTYAALVQAGSAPAVPIIPTDISVCQYDTLILSGSTAIGNTIQWKKSGSGYVFNGNTVTIPQASLQDEGIYYAQSIDPNGCASSQLAVNVHVGFKPLIHEVHVNCNTNMLADLIVDADASLGSLTYSLDGITYQSSNTFLNISGGIHQVYVKEFIGTCVSMVEVHVPNCACLQSSPIQFDIVSLSCGNALIPVNAMFNNTVQGHWSSDGSGYFTQVNGNSPLLSSYQPSVTDIQKGMVKLILTTDDPDGVGPCEAESNFFLVYLFDTMPNIQISGDTHFCQGDQIKFQSNGLYSSIWSGPSGVLGEGQGLILNKVSPIQSGKYYVELEGNNCPLKKDSIDIQIAAAPNLVISQTTIPEKCAGQGNGQVQFDISGGSGVYQVAYGRPITSIQGSSPVNIKWLSSETYTFYIADTTCPNAKDSLSVTLPDGYFVDPPLDAFYNAPACEGESLILQSSASSVSQFVWTQQGSVFEEIGNPVIRLESNTDMSGDYTVSRLENGCLSVPLHLQVKVFGQPEIQQIDTLCEETMNGGKIIIHAKVTGDDALEYALNNGVYQDSPVFEGLTNGLYQAQVRVKGSDCSTTQTGIELYCHCDCNKTNTVGIFPNPNAGSFMLSIQLMEEVDHADVSLIDLSGRIIYKQDLNIDGLLAQVPLKIEALVPGAYWLKVNLGLEKSILPLQIND